MQIDRLETSLERVGAADATWGLDYGNYTANKLVHSEFYL